MRPYSKSNFSHALHTIRPIKGRTDDIEGSEVGKGDGDEEAEHEGTEKENDSWDAKNAAHIGRDRGGR